VQPIADLMRKALQTKGVTGKHIKLRDLDGGVREDLVKLVHEYALAHAGGDPADEWRPFRGVYTWWWRDDGGLTEAERDRVGRLRTDVNNELKARGLAKHLTENAKGYLYVRRAPESPAGGNAHQGHLAAVPPDDNRSHAVSKGQAALDTADDAYTPPPQGGDVPKSRVFETDPDKMDRGTTAHKNTQDALAQALRKADLKPRSPRLGDPAFDIAWRDDAAGGTAFICEVKSLTGENEIGQIRLAIGQVLDYVHRLDSLREADSLPPHWKSVHAVRAVVAVERRPAGDVHWSGLCERHGIILTWPEKYPDTLAALASTGLFERLGAGALHAARPDYRGKHAGLDS